VSISWVIFNGITNEIEKQRNYIIKPKHWTIPDDSIAIHGITNEKANQEGVALEKVLGEFLAETYDVLVAHNLDFDINVLYNAIRWDLELQFKPLKKKTLCSMELSKDICKFPGNFGKYKSPKLSELYEYVFGKPPVRESLHNSLYDVLVLTEVIKHCNPLRIKMNLPVPKVDHVENASKKSTVLYID